MSEASARETLHEAIQASIATDDELPEGAMLMGWVAVAEWMAPDGHRWLSKLAGDARGETAPEWQEQGYLHNALFDGAAFNEDPSS